MWITYQHYLFWFVIMVSISGGQLHPPSSCTEDSQCSSEFYCEESAHFCRECLRCDELKRESPPSDACVKSVIDCGVCFKGLVQEYDGRCSQPSSKSPGRILPPYGWAAIAASVLLMAIILCIFIKMNTFKIAYSSRTSVQSLPVLQQPPPPYNNLDHFPPAARQYSPSNDNVETHKLMELPYIRAPPTENALQGARVFSVPDYAPPQIPLSSFRSMSPDIPASEDENGPTDFVPTNDISNRRLDVVRTENNSLSNTVDDASKENSKRCTSANPLRQSTEPEEEQDSNNNSSGEESPNHRPAHNLYCSNVMAGPSFVINVVENIHNIQQQNDLTR